MMKRRHWQLLLCLCVSLAPATAWPAGGVSIVGGMTHQAVMDPGARTEGTIVLRNNSDEPRDVRIYQTDYAFYADGKNVYGEPGHIARSNAKWISFTPSQATIAPGHTESVYYTVNVPKDEKLTGTYWSVLMVEPMPPSALELPKQSAGQVNVGIRTVTRYAVQMVTNVGKTGVPNAKFSSKRLLIGRDRRSLQVDVENTGERWLIPQIWADIFDATGKSMGRFAGNRLRIYPGCSARFEVDLSGLPKGKFSALVVADNCDDNLFGTQCQFEIQ